MYILFGWNYSLIESQLLTIAIQDRSISNGYFSYGYTERQFDIQYRKRSRNLDFKDPRIKKKAEFEKKQYEVEKQNHINNLLNENIFRPLRKDMIEIFDEDDRDVIPFIDFDPLKIRDRDYYIEGIKHLKSKIDNFEERFNEIENEVKEYNYELMDFEEKGLNNLLSKFFEENGFNTTDKTGVMPTKNTIIIEYLIDHLIRYWKYNENLESKLKLEGELFKINETIIASMDPENEDRLRDCIRRSKNQKDIVNKYEDLRDRLIKIINNTESLKEEIIDNLVLPIDLGTYVP